MSTTTTETAAVTEHPIIFSAAMVRAILDGKKTMTRRIVKRQPGPDIDPERLTACRPMRRGRYTFTGNDQFDPPCEISLRPYAFPGDRLWVKEVWRPIFTGDEDGGDVLVRYPANDGAEVFYADDRVDLNWRWPKAARTGNVSPLYLPRWASRVTLEITDVRVERVQSISEDDAQAEGIASEELPWDPDSFHRPGSYGYVSGVDPEGLIYHTRVEAFRELWDSIHGKGAWDANPWTWVLTFRRLEVPHA